VSLLRLVADCRSADVLFCSFLIFASVLLPPTSIPVLESVRGNYYMASLLPLLFPVMFVFVVPNWVSMKMFRHN
jgi:hypothetical protein